MTEVDVFQANLERYPASRYPVQHATAQFHFGTMLLQSNQVGLAMATLAVAARMFGEMGMRLECAKAMMLHGAAQRAAGQHDDAANTFVAAREIFDSLSEVAEAAAADFNLGLVLAETADFDGAVDAFCTARRRFLETGRRVWASAAAREHGAALFNSGHATAAIPLLQESIDLADTSDPPGAGAAANILGLAQLASGEPAAAVESFRVALGWHPRSVRPTEHAMVKANLALAYEATGAHAQARLLARYAAAMEQSDEPVSNVAHGVLERLPIESGSDLFDVLDQVPPEQRDIWLRDEMLYWWASDVGIRNCRAALWLAQQVDRGAEGIEQAQALLGAVLELPPDAYEGAVRALVQATAEVSPEKAERFQAVTRSAMARYPMPQWQRMAASFTAEAEKAGYSQAWN